ncbi:uncharacterized protein LOC123294666 [Chrysoperla carnea]|uniref:uncharacterized protein LOC123294666 n=1 Tax=Chrysoperla carnea TaxID=189513 RepID=UPI001D069971|nr:uncharacterized protein LOC123294666 [Chrysoperla carnea]
MCEQSSSDYLKEAVQNLKIFQPGTLSPYECKLENTCPEWKIKWKFRGPPIIIPKNSIKLNHFIKYEVKHRKLKYTDDVNPEGLDEQWIPIDPKWISQTSVNTWK